MSRLIDAEYLLDLIKDINDVERFGYIDAEDINNAPTVDAVPVVHGHWIKADLDHDYVTCSNCKELNRNDRLAFIPDYAKGMHYCMICGAKMDEVTE